MTDTVTNRYLTGLYAPLDQEHTAFDLEVTGTLPDELDGRYLRNGPNPFAPPDPATYHWFTGDGMVHGIRMRGGRAEWYRNRWIRSTAVSTALGETPVPGERHGGMESANTNVIGHAGSTYAIIEAGGRPVELTDELETVRFSDFGGTLRYGFSAHPTRDPETDELHTISYYWGRPEVLDYTVVGASGLVVHQADLPVPGNPMVHDCAVTERSVVVFDLPVTFHLDQAMAGLFPYIWDDDYVARVGLVPLRGGSDEVQWFEVDPCYVFHTVNAHDVGEQVVVDLIRHPRMFATDRHGPNDGTPTLWRWTLDRLTGQARTEQLDDRAIEFPRVDERVVGRAHRYSWAIGLGTDGSDVDFPGRSMVRYDARDDSSDVVQFGPGRTAGELVFVPRSVGAAEDDGWYLTLVHDAATDRSELVVLDASAPADEPVARVHLPTRIPLGFHGNWVPSGT